MYTVEAKFKFGEVEGDFCISHAAHISRSCDIISLHKIVHNCPFQYLFKITKTPLFLKDDLNVKLE